MAISILTLINPTGESVSLYASDNAGGGLGGTLVNKGTIIQQGGGDLELSDGVLLKNQARATYDYARVVQIDGQVINGKVSIVATKK